MTQTGFRPMSNTTREQSANAVHDVIVGSLGSRKRELDAHMDIVMILEQLEAMDGD